jgi:hypothetical protein
VDSGRDCLSSLLLTTDAGMAGLPQYFTAADHFEEPKDGMTRAGAMTQNVQAVWTHFNMIA